MSQRGGGHCAGPAVAAPFDFSSPTRLLFGAGAIGRLPEIVKEWGGGTVAMVIDPALGGNESVGELRVSLKGVAARVEIDTEIRTEPTTVVVDNLARWLASVEPAVVVGIGGGSTLDATKAARAVAACDTPIASCLGRTVELPPPCGRLALVPTTSGTGSEVNPFAVIQDENRGLKLGMTSVALTADVAVVDSDLTHTAPPHVTAAAGVDALTHGVEAYCSRAASPISDALAHRAVELCIAALLPAYQDGSNAAARSGMAEAATLAGLAFANAHLGLCHALSGPLGTRFHLAHGVANGLLLPSVLRFNQPAVPDRIAALDALAGGDLADWVTRLCSKLSFPRRLDDLNTSGGARVLDAIAEEAMLSAQVATNPRRFGRREGRAILEEVR